MSILPMGHEYKFVRKYSKKITTLITIFLIIIFCSIFWWCIDNGSFDCDVKAIIIIVAFTLLDGINMWFLYDVELKDEYRNK
jgi:nitrogen fixation-related uncharacterized protein